MTENLETQFVEGVKAAVEAPVVKAEAIITGMEKAAKSDAATALAEIKLCEATLWQKTCSILDHPVHLHLIPLAFIAGACAVYFAR